ncbi:hypothetical protein NYE80_15210 [Paenibacillus sp. FSL H7-0357]
MAGYGRLSKSTPLTVTVADVSPGQAVLSNDNWDIDGSFKVSRRM